MEIKIEVPEYDPTVGMKYTWESGFEIETKVINGEIIISSNAAGLISLAKQLLTLAQNSVPTGSHFHYDVNNSLEEGSVELVIEKK